MPFSIKNWINGQTLDANGIKDLELRLSNYTAIEVINTVAAAGSARTLPDPTTQSISLLTLTSANCNLTFPTAVAGTSFTLVLKQDATGSRLVTWPLNTRWAGATQPTLSTAANAIDVLSFTCIDGATWYSFLSGKGMA